MDNLLFYSCILVVAISTAVASRQDAINQILDDRKACQIDSPYLNKCMKRALEEAFPKVAKGIKALNISPIDPLFVRETKTQYRSSFSLFANGKVNNVRINGLSKTQIKAVKTYVNKTHIDIEVISYLPELSMDGLYEGAGNLGLLALNSKGYFNLTTSGITMLSRTVGALQTIKDEKFLRLTQFNLDPTMTSMKMFATGIVPSPLLNDAILSLVNNFWPVFYRQMLPETKQIWEPILIKDVNQFLSVIPIRRLLYYSYERNKLMFKS